MNESNDRAVHFVKIASMANDSEALVVKSLLESHGIHVLMKTPLVQSVHPITVNGVGLVSVFVPEEDETRAREILDEDGLPRVVAE